MIFIWKLPFFFGSLTRGKREAGVCLSVWFISLIADNILDFHVIFCFVFFPPDLVLTPTKWNAVDAITVEKIVGIFPKWRRRHRLATHSPEKKKKWLTLPNRRRHTRGQSMTEDDGGCCCWPGNIWATDTTGLLRWCVWNRSLQVSSHIIYF